MVYLKSGPALPERTPDSPKGESPVRPPLSNGQADKIRIDPPRVRPSIRLVDAFKSKFAPSLRKVQLGGRAR